MTDCLFCKIVNGEIPSTLFAENDGAVAFDDINPVAPIHFLVVPREHVQSTDDLEPDHRAAVVACIELIRDAARARGLVPGGYRVLTNTGPDAGQVVPHMHFHVIGGRSLTWPPG